MAPPSRHAGDLTWDVVVWGLDAGWEVGVLWDGMGVVVQKGKLRQDIRVPGHQDRGQHLSVEGKGHRSLVGQKGKSIKTHYTAVA